MPSSAQEELGYYNSVQEAKAEIEKRMKTKDAGKAKDSNFEPRINERNTQAMINEIMDLSKKLELGYNRTDLASNAADKLERLLKELRTRWKSYNEDSKKAKDAATKLVHTEGGQGSNKQVKVYFDSELDEYVCKLYMKKPQGWVYYSKADYFTDDIGDAIGTAKQMVAY